MVRNRQYGMTCALAVSLFVLLLARAAPAAPVPADAAASDPYENRWVYRVAPWRREAVVAVTVEATGRGDAPADEEPCQRFEPHAQDVKDFVARGRKVSKRDFLHETTWSACHATGRLRLRGGGEARWLIQRYGAGYLEIAGRRHYLDCEDCRFATAVSGGDRAPVPVGK